VRARTLHREDRKAGVPLTKTFNEHLLRILQAEAKNPEVQNRYDRALAAGPNPGPNVSFSGNEANPLFRADGDAFVEVGATLGLGRTEDSRGFALVDLDQDGAQDVVLHNFFRNPLVALLNRAAGTNRWIRIRLRGVASNRFGIGARVAVSGRVQEMSGGGGYLSAQAPELHFGLGTMERADVEVRWPSGRTESYFGLTAGRLHTLREGDPAGRREEELRPLPVDIPRAPAAPEAVVPREVLKGLRKPGGAPGAPAGASSVIAVLIRPSCHACVEEVGRLADTEARARAAGAELVWVALEGSPEETERRLRSVVPTARVGVPAAPLRVPSTPEVWWITPSRAERFTGRHAVAAALEEAARLR
jgi:hypothetical protein